MHTATLVLTGAQRSGPARSFAWFPLRQLHEPLGVVAHEELGEAEAAPEAKAIALYLLSKLCVLCATLTTVKISL